MGKYIRLHKRIEDLTGHFFSFLLTRSIAGAVRVIIKIRSKVREKRPGSCETEFFSMNFAGALEKNAGKECTVRSLCREMKSSAGLRLDPARRKGRLPKKGERLFAEKR